MKTVELSDGAVAQVREGTRFTNRQQAALFAALYEASQAASKVREEFEADVAAGAANPLDLFGRLSSTERNAILGQFVVSWTVVREDGSPMPLPSEDPAATDDLLVADTRAVVEAIAPELAYLMPTFELEAEVDAGDGPFGPPADTAGSEPQPSGLGGTESTTTADPADVMSSAS